MFANEAIKVGPPSGDIRELKQLRRRPQRQLQKKKNNNRFNDQNNALIGSIVSREGGVLSLLRLID